MPHTPNDGSAETTAGKWPPESESCGVSRARESVEEHGAADHHNRAKREAGASDAAQHGGSADQQKRD
jgi:hypothetical protein